MSRVRDWIKGKTDRYPRKQTSRYLASATLSGRLNLRVFSSLSAKEALALAKWINDNYGKG